jgi:hypothetical protein
MSLKINELQYPRLPAAKKRGGKNEGNLHYVIENTWSKNVRTSPLHYIAENTAI